MKTQPAVRCMLIRGGTSKGAYFLKSDLPESREERDALLLSIMGSPHPDQIDGIGGGHPLRSKVAIVTKSAEPGVDVDFLFAHALKWSPGTVKVTAIVSHPATLQYIREGYTNLLLANQVYEWGKRPVDLLFDAIQNGKYPADWFIKISLLPVTKENVDDLYKRWQGWLQGQSS
jgi:hypothetical protein